METLPSNERPAKRWGPCGLCKRWVTKAKDREGHAVVVERCADGRGDVGLTDPLFEGDPLLAVPMKGWKYRTHRCVEERAHSAAAFEGKKGSKLPNTSYRTSAPKASGGRK